MDFQMLDQYVHEVCQETKCYMGDGEWIVYLDGVIYANVKNALQKQKAKSLSGDKQAQDPQKVEEKIRGQDKET